MASMPVNFSGQNTPNLLPASASMTPAIPSFTPFGLTPMFTSGFDPWANSPLADIAKGFASLPNTPGNGTPTGLGQSARSSVFEFPSGIEEQAVEALMSASRKKRRSSVDLQDAALMGTPLFSPNGTSHDQPQASRPNPPPPDSSEKPRPVIVLDPVPVKRKDRPTLPKHVEEEEEERYEDDEKDDDYVPQLKKTPEFKSKRTLDLDGSRVVERSSPSKRGDGADSDDEVPTKHKPARKHHQQQHAPETADDMVRRETHVCQALQVNNISEIFTLFVPSECFLVTVYPCKDPTCNNSRKSCVHRVNRFQSTRNSKRHVHAYLYYKLVKGLDALVPDDTIRLLWKWLESSCANGLKNANGHGKAPDGRTCVNPYHYRLSGKHTLDTLPTDDAN